MKAAEGEEEIQRALFVGNYDAAVEACFKAGRMADALLVANIGGAELYKRAMGRYMRKQPRPYMQARRSGLAAAPVAAPAAAALPPVHHIRARTFTHIQYEQRWSKNTLRTHTKMLQPWAWQMCPWRAAPPSIAARHIPHPAVAAHRPACRW
jgi:hypothetical protein